MAELSSLPPELVLRVAHFLAPDHPGNDLLDEGLHDRNSHARRMLYPIHARRNDLHNFSRTCRSFYGLLFSQRLQSVGFDDITGISATKRMLVFLRYLRNNPEARRHVVRLYVHSPVPYNDPEFSDYAIGRPLPLRISAGLPRPFDNYDYTGFPSDVSMYPEEHTSTQRISEDIHDIKMLEDLALPAQIQYIWMMVNKHYHNKLLHKDGRSLNQSPAVRTRAMPTVFLNSLLVSLLLVYLPNIQYLLLALPFEVHSLVLEALSDVKTAKDHVKGTPILQLKSLAVSGLQNKHQVSDVLSSGINFLSCFELCDALYVGGFALQRYPSFRSMTNLTSLTFDRVMVSFKFLRSAIKNCQQLKRFVYIHPSFAVVTDHDFGHISFDPQMVVDALEVHWTTIETFCLDFSHYTQGSDTTDGINISSLKRFTSLESLWIDCDCFGLQLWKNNDGISFSTRLPASVRRLHLANSVGTVSKELLLWQNELIDGAADVLVPKELELEEMFTQWDAQSIVKDLVAMFQKTEIPSVRLRSVCPTAW